MTTEIEKLKTYKGVERYVFREIVTERVGPHILDSRIEDCTQADVDAAIRRFKDTGHCGHEYVWDEPGYLYNFRECAVCGKGMGAI